jgi:hypothetical protein
MMLRERRKKHLSNAYSFPGFRPQASKVRGVFGNSKARILPTILRSKDGMWRLCYGPFCMV